MGVVEIGNNPNQLKHKPSANMQTLMDRMVQATTTPAVLTMMPLPMKFVFLKKFIAMLAKRKSQAPENKPDKQQKSQQTKEKK